ncbi:Fe-S oxidoreductase, partial [Streptoalloteichus tenebrarius]
MQLAAILVSIPLSVLGWGLFLRALWRVVAVVRLGAPDPTRTDDWPGRVGSVLRETLGHTRMLKWTLVGFAHWWVFLGFVLLVPTLVNAYGQLADPAFVLPGVGHWWPFELVTEVFAAATLVTGLTLVVIRQLHHPRRPERQSRFAGSSFWQAYFVESVIIAIPVLVLVLRGLEGVLQGVTSYDVHFAISYPLVLAFSGLSRSAVENAVWGVAGLKIAISMVWFIVVGLVLTMGVAWHRFTVFFNVLFKREPRGIALGAVKPMMSGGKPLDFEEADPDKDVFGAGKVEDFSWKGWLDFTTCTECGRCQSQCPAWN